MSYSAELARRDIETTIMVLGAFTKRTNHFTHSGKPGDTYIVAEYQDEAYARRPSRRWRGSQAWSPQMPILKRSSMLLLITYGQRCSGPLGWLTFFHLVFEQAKLHDL